MGGSTRDKLASAIKAFEELYGQDLHFAQGINAALGLEEKVVREEEAASIDSSGRGTSGILLQPSSAHSNKIMEMLGKTNLVLEELETTVTPELAEKSFAEVYTQPKNATERAVKNAADIFLDKTEIESLSAEGANVQKAVETINQSKIAALAMRVAAEMKSFEEKIAQQEKQEKPQEIKRDDGHGKGFGVIDKLIELMDERWKKSGAEKSEEKGEGLVRDVKEGEKIVAPQTGEAVGKAKQTQR